MSADRPNGKPRICVVCYNPSYHWVRCKLTLFLEFRFAYLMVVEICVGVLQLETKEHIKVCLQKASMLFSHVALELCIADIINRLVNYSDSNENSVLVHLFYAAFVNVAINTYI